MGQKISALKRKVPSVKKYSQRKSDSDGFLSQATSSKADCAVLSPKVPDSKEDAQCQSKTNGSISQPASSEEDPQRQSNTNGSLSRTTSPESKYAVLSSRAVDIKEDAQRQSNADGSLSHTTPLENECAVLSLRMTDNKEDTPRQRNVDESLLPTSSSEDQYAALSSNMINSRKNTRSQIDIDRAFSPTASSRALYAALSSSMIKSFKNTRSQIDIDEALLRTTLDDRYSDLSSSIADSWEDTQSQIDFDKIISPTTSSRDLYATLSLSMTDSWEDTESQIDIDESLSPHTSSDDESSDEYSDLSSSMTDRCEDTQSLIEIDESLSRTTSDNIYARRFTTLLDLSSRNMDLDDYYSQKKSREKKRSVLSSKGKRGVQPGNIRKSSEDSLRIGKSEVDTVPKSLLKLSTDLILEIADYLPPSSYMSLSYTCRRIRNGMGASIEYVLGDKAPIGRWKSSVQPIEMRNIRLLERIEWRRLLDRDGKVPSSQAYCSGCFCSHDRSLFSTKSLAEPSTRRRCLGSAGRVWICPHLSLGFHQAKELISGSKPKQIIGCEGRFVSDYGRFYRFCGIYSSAGSFYTWWPIMKMPSEGLPSNQEVEEALRPLKAPMCPHLRLNDSCVASAYLKGLDHDIIFEISHPGSRCICMFCGLSARFMIKDELYGPQTLVLITRRTLEQSMRSCTDRAWICHVVDPADLKEYEEAWHAANVECWQKVGSVVDRFLLS